MPAIQQRNDGRVRNAVVAWLAGGICAAIAPLSCARDDGRVREVGDAPAAADEREASESSFPFCALNENHGPGFTTSLHGCTGTMLVDVTWQPGDPTPAGTYDCHCDEGNAAPIRGSDCEDALVAACGVDLRYPQPCTREGSVCWPTPGQEGVWRCSCEGQQSVVEGNVATACADALDAQCGPWPDRVCFEGAPSPDGGISNGGACEETDAAAP